MSEYAYEHDIGPRPVEPPTSAEDMRDIRMVELMEMLHRGNTQPPASKMAIQELDIVVFDNRDLKKFVEPCPICFCAFQLEEEGTKMPCKHLFHSNCILPWLESHNTCPMCRYELPTIDPFYEEKRLQRLGMLPTRDSTSSRPNVLTIQDILMGRVPNPNEDKEDEDDEEEMAERRSRALPVSMYT